MTEYNQISSGEMMNAYAQLREDFREAQSKWLKFFPIINILYVVNVLIIIGSLVFGYFSAKKSFDDTLLLMQIMATIVAFGFAGVFVFTILWKFVFFFVRLGKRATLSKLKKKLEDALLIKISVISQINLKPTLAEKDAHLANIFSNKKNRWKEIENELYQGQCKYLEMQLKKMCLIEWQWIKYSFMVAASIIIAIMAIYLMAVVVILALVWAFLTSGSKYENYSHETPRTSEEKIGNKPSKYTLLLEDLDDLQKDLVKRQRSAEKIKNALLNWGTPNSVLFRNEELLIPHKQ